jgi:AAA15 family ATPase/GTPase
MLLEFSVRNFRSFRDEQTLSLVAGTGDEHEATHTMPIPGSDDERALRSAAIYGPNASGKTNLLLALNAMREVVVKSATSMQRGDEIYPIDPFRLTEAGRTSPTEFAVSFAIDEWENEKEFEYRFEATRERVLSEGLYTFPHGRRRTWYERTLDANHPEGTFNKSSYFSGQKEQIWQATRPNALYLSTAAQLNNEDLSVVFDWFRNALTYLAGRRLAIDSPPGGTYTAKACEEDEDMKEQILALLEAADVGIHDLYVEEQPVDLSEFPSELIEAIDNAGRKEEIEKDLSRSIRFQHTEEADEEGFLDLQEESHGTQQFFSLVGPVLDVLEKGRVLLVDELDSSLHPEMVVEIVSLFNDPETNTGGAQLIFNTHDTTLLDQDLLRRDQIWLTEKFGDGATTLTSLFDFSPRKRTEALEKNYRQGRYGGVPIPRVKDKARALKNWTKPADE